MQKDELIQMHTLLCQLKHQLESSESRGPIAGVSPRRFAEYEGLKISPLHVHRSKTEHKKAIFTLGKELAELLSRGDLSNSALVSHRFDAFAHRGELPERPRVL